MPAPKNQVTATFSHERDTKNKVRFAEDGNTEDHKIGTLYVAKDVLAGLGNPDTLTVTIKG